MSELLETGKLFFEACDGGKGWEVCREYCHADATFAVQANLLAEINTLEAYTEWAKGLLTPFPDANYELKYIAENEASSTVVGVGVFRGTHTGPGGPVEPTGKSVSTEYVYAMEFEDGRIKHINKVWNDAYTLQQAGWA